MNHKIALQAVVFLSLMIGLSISLDRVQSQEVKQGQDNAKGGERELDVPYWPTPAKVVDKMLELAEVKKGDVVYDLGCGDGRIVVAAAKKHGVKCFGFDLDPERVKESLDNVKKNHVEDLVTIKKADIFTLDLKEASVVTLYLYPELNVRLMPQLEKLKPGSRIISHDWDMKGAKPNKLVKMRAKSDMGLEREHKIYLWVVPWEKE
jgi:SAM-dependent methyltransferase